MTGLLLTVLERLPPGVRRFVVAAAAALALAAVMAALTLTSPPGGNKRPPTRRPPPAGISPPSSPRRLPPPVSAVSMRDARRVAERFLAGYLPFMYGRGSVLAISHVTPALRLRLLRERSLLTPAERRRRPRVMALQTVGTTPGFVVATATIDDGGVVAYRLRFTLQRTAGRWTVSGVADG